MWAWKASSRPRSPRRRRYRTMRLPELENELKTIYGEDGPRVFRTILPGILMDFTRMINAAGPDAPVQEIYHLEDGKGAVVLRCRKVSGVPGPIEADLRK